MSTQVLDTVRVEEFLKEFLPTVDTHIPTVIQHGGCGHFANLLHKYLKEMGIESTIQGAVYEDEVEDMKKLNSEEAPYSDLNIEGFAHVVIKIGDNYYDNRGLVDFQDEWIGDIGLFSGGTVDLEITEDALLETLKDESIWNDMFDRSQVPVIEEYIYKMGEYYEQWLKGELKLKFQRKELNSYSLSYEW